MLNGASKCMLTPPPRVLGKGTKNPRDPISAQRIAHPRDEAFFVVDGEVDFECGGTSK